jgi:ATP-binding cassette subfamily B multidrug efflux pump
MKIVFRYLKPFTIALIFCIILLFIQSMTDLSLPNLMSDIVNVGIQQGGIKETAPKAISENGFALIAFFMPDSDKELAVESYQLVKSGSEEAQRYIRDYPLLEKENIYLYTAGTTLNKSAGDTSDTNTDDQAGKTKTEEINLAFGRASLSFVKFMQGMAASGMGSLQAPGAESALPGGNAQAPGGERALTEGTDTKAVLENIDMSALYQMLPMFKQLPAEALQDAMEKAQAADSSLARQVGTAFTRLFYTELGMDMNQLQRSYILRTGLIMLLVTLLGAAAAIGVGFFASRIGAGVSKELRKDIFNKAESFSLEEFDRFSTASLITRTTNDVTQVQMLIIMGIRMLVSAPIMGIGGIVMALRKSLSLSWIIAVAVIVLIGVIAILFTVAMPKFKLMQKLVDRLNLVTRESLSGMMVIRAFSNQGHEEKRFEKASRDLADTNRFIGRTVSIMMPFMMLIMNLTSLVIIWAGAHEIEKSALQVGDMMAFIQYGMQIIMAFLMIAIMFVMVPRAAVSAARISEVLETEPSIRDKSDVKSFHGRCRGEIEFRNVSFRYKGAENDALQNISFTAKPGQTTAFIGSTGSGKTTLVNLIPRFYDVTRGEVRIDGISVKDLSQHELRENIGYVPQKSTLFSGDINSNILYGKENAAPEEVSLASETAQASEFIESSEDGYHTEIAQGGANVSGGQKQRLSIARALIKRAPIYIFDDSFSALDFKTDAALRRALKKYVENATVLIVAQRVSTIMNAEQIIVLDKGRMVGIGKHKELLRTCKEYREIAESQLSEEELA